jgi:hypothetical protein
MGEIENISITRDRRKLLLSVSPTKLSGITKPFPQEFSGIPQD